MAAIDKYFDLMAAVWSLEMHARDEAVTDPDIREMVISVAGQVRGGGNISVRVPEPTSMPMFDDDEDDEPAWSTDAREEMKREMELTPDGS